MSSKKREIRDRDSECNVKKSASKFPKSTASTPQLVQEVDFPRGGGTSFTPLEVKAIRAEAAKEVNDELLVDTNEKKSKKRKRKSETETSKVASGQGDSKNQIRIEHLNYKKITVGMKIFGQIIYILPLALIISLPNQLFAHVPVINISSQFTEYLEHVDEDDLESLTEGQDDNDTEIPLKPFVLELNDIFRVGQYVRAVVTAVHDQGTTISSGIGKARDAFSKASKRVELSLIPNLVNAGVRKSDLKAGFTLTAAIKSQEDHGYLLDVGISDVSGFLPYDSSIEGSKNQPRTLHVGSLVNVTVTKLSPNGRTCAVTASPTTFATSCLTEVSSVTSLLPGSLVQALITSVHPDGLNLQVLGFFEGTIDQLHLEHGKSKHKPGKRVKCRILYDYSSSPPKLALSLKEHIVKLRSQLTGHETRGDLEKSLPESYPNGTVLPAVQVLRLEEERGLIMEIVPGQEGFVHISHTSDDHVPVLSASGPWKIGSIHPARVTGYFAFDDILQLSLKPSILNQKYFQVSDVQVGEIVKGTIKKLTNSALFVSLEGGMDGVVWPNHYADITLKHPSKRFKAGTSLRCRVLVVDSDKGRLSLTAKKTLVDSTLPVIAKLEDVVVGKVTHATIFKVHEKHILVEFYNNIKAIVPSKEISDTPKNNIEESYPLGRVVRVRILDVNDGRIMASIRHATSAFDLVTDISSIEIGNTVAGSVSEIHKENAVLSLEPSRIRALISLKNLANHRNMTLTQLRSSLRVGEMLDELVVVSRNPEKYFVIIANKPKLKQSLTTRGSGLKMDSVTIGQIVSGRVTGHSRKGSLIKITNHIRGILHICDMSDDFGAGPSLPANDSILKAVVVDIDLPKRQLALSTRRSRMHPNEVQNVVNPEIRSLSDLQEGQNIGGFVKNVVEHGLFVAIGRGVDARVQIRELFDEYVKDWQSHFKEHQFVKGRILSVDASNLKVEMSLKTETSHRQKSSYITLSDLKKGQKIDGTIKKIEDFGLFIQFEGSRLSGLCHKSQLSDNLDADVSVALRGFREGDQVKAFVLGIDNRRISLSLKPSYFTKDELEETHKNGDDEDVSIEEVPESHESSSDEFAERENLFTIQDEESDDEMNIDVDDFQTAFHPQDTSKSLITPASKTPALNILGGFQWSGNTLNNLEGGDSSSEDEDSAQPKKKKRRTQIEYDFTEEMHTRTPESNADFERLLLGAPNSSFLWIQYMSFQLPLSEIGKAREIARRAFQTINFREENEKLNVWLALLNLENVYGTDESLEAVFKEAARANDSKTVHLKLAAIFDQSDKPEKAEEQYRRTCKKFGHSSKVWTLFGELKLKQGNMEEARKLLPRSLQSLEKRKHLKTISKFAQLEYKYGDPERGKTLFEGIIDSHPKRWDMWLVYLDMEASQSNIQSLRNLFDRIFTMKMTSHKAKSFFKKWLELERRIGDEDGANIVKEKAVEWTQRAA